MPDFDIVIAHRGPELGLWVTITSIERELRGKGYDYAYHIVENGVEEQDWATKLLVEDLEKLQTCKGSYTLVPEPMSPPAARNLGASKGIGEVVFFFDNHIMVEPGYFENALSTIKLGADAVHSVTRFFAGGPAAYHYRFTLERNFWGYQVPDAVSTLPYRIAAGAHGGFAIRRSVWEELGGYWDGFVGYGGEESYFELMMGMRDKISYLDPQMIHWHHPGIRTYQRDKSDDFIRNMLMCANIVGGDMWAQRVYNGLVIRNTKHDNKSIDFHTLYHQAMANSSDFAAKFQRKAKRTLNEQLVQFSRLKVAQ